MSTRKIGGTILNLNCSKQWGIWVKSGFTATYATRKKTWEKVNDSVAIEKGNIIHARKNHIRVHSSYSQ